MVLVCTRDQCFIDAGPLPRRRLCLHSQRCNADRSGKKVLEIKGLSKSFGGRVLFEPFDFTLLYGERVRFDSPRDALDADWPLGATGWRVTVDGDAPLKVDLAWGRNWADAKS